MRARRRAACIVMTIGVILGLHDDAVLGAQHSELWGETGERWTPQSRLPDFSFAGYHSGEDALPRVDVATTVSAFGATGDDETDDTEAFKQAIAATESGAILIPAGRYLLSDILWITKPELVLRGEGPAKTILHFTNELEDVRPNMGATTGGRPTSNYSWSGGFLWAKGQNTSKLIAPIAANAKRGDTDLVLGRNAKLEIGQRVRIAMRDSANGTLFAHLYSGDPGDTAKIIKPITVSMVSRIRAIDGTQVTLERPLRWDITQAWSPTLRTFAPTVSEVGIEDLGISFPAKPYKGHFTERGMNGIAMNGVADCWIRNVEVRNCDSGVFVAGTFCSVDGLSIDGVRTARNGDTGHHGVILGQDCLMENFDIRAKFIHDITMSNRQAGNVVKNGRGTNLSFDHHKRAPYENLFCNIHVGKGSQIWRSGGGRALGKHCGARGTFWCISADQNMKLPSSSFGPDSLNIIGIRTRAAANTGSKGKWHEAIAPEELEPADLHAAQLAQRLKTQSTK